MDRPYLKQTHFSIAEENDSKNFIIKGNNAYTEDNVLIYNIFVYSIPIQSAEGDVRHYFSKFGVVLDVKLVADKNSSRQMAFVNFAEPESACSVLRNYNHRMHGSRIGVRAGESWEQPNADNACHLKKNEDDVASTSKDSWKDATATNGDTHMLSLNDDCIETIFGYLKLKEQVRFARVCERFKDIFQMYYKRQSKNFDLSNIRDMTLWEMLDFFRFAGGNIATITGTIPFKNHGRIVELIRQFCRKLKRIRLGKSKMRIECLDELLRGYPQLKELTLRNCALNDNSIQTMTHLNRLEILDLAENNELTGKFISNLVQLKELNLFGCYNIQTTHLMDICKSLSNLRSLDIRYVELLLATFFGVMVEYCKELEVLKMTCPEFPYKHVALLPRLKQLELLDYIIFGTAQKRLLAELVAHKANQLEVLKISTQNTLRAKHFALISELTQLKTLFVPYNDVSDNALIKLCKLQQLEYLTIKGCSKVTNETLLMLVKSCPKLRRLSIKFCNQITIEFLLNAIRFLKASEKRKHPLVILAYGTGVEDYDDTAYEELKEAEEQSLISVNFDASSLEPCLEDGVDFYDIWDDERWCEEDDDPR